MGAYQELEQHFTKISLLGDVTGVLAWDCAVWMPPGGAAARSAQMVLLRVMQHELTISPMLSDLLEKVEAQGLDFWQRANLCEMRRICNHARALPSELVKANSEACADCEVSWRQARAENNFNLVAEKLVRVVAFAREIAHIKAEVLGVLPYDALLDQFEPGLRQADIHPLFAAYSAFFPELLEAALLNNKPLPQLHGSFATQKQQALCQDVMSVMGFDFNHGRLDVSTHPFCGGIPSDIRMTTRYDEVSFVSALMGVIHETGHALYEMGLPEKWRNQPVGKARGMVMHESQSLFWEMQIGRGESFLTRLEGKIEEHLGQRIPLTTLKALYNHVEPSFIRVDADEITYPAHIILRYTLEKALLSGDLLVPDLPGAWDDQLEKLLALRPKNQGEGCLQDIHWYDGAIGYFPTYSLGAMAAAQLKAAYDQEQGDEDLKAVLCWLRDSVHTRASSASMAQIIKDATGQALSIEPFMAHLKERYLN